MPHPGHTRPRVPPLLVDAISVVVMLPLVSPRLITGRPAVGDQCSLQLKPPRYRHALCEASSVR
jgi:hypothetical protein